MEYVPIWLAGLLPPLQQIIGQNMPSRWKPLSLLALAVVATVASILLNPAADWEQFGTILVALYGLATGAYTVAKALPSRPGAVAGAVALLGGLAALLWALPAAADTVAEAVEALPIRETVNLWATVGLSLLGGWLARLLRKIP